MDATEELNFIKSMYAKDYKLLGYAVETNRVAALFELKSNGVKVIHYSDMVLGESQSYAEQYKSATFVRLYEWLYS